METYMLKDEQPKGNLNNGIELLEMKKLCGLIVLLQGQINNLNERVDKAAKVVRTLEKQVKELEAKRWEEFDDLLAYNEKVEAEIPNENLAVSE